MIFDETHPFFYLFIIIKFLQYAVSPITKELIIKAINLLFLWLSEKKDQNNHQKNIKLITTYKWNHYWNKIFVI